MNSSPIVRRCVEVLGRDRKLRLGPRTHQRTGTLRLSTRRLVCSASSLPGAPSSSSSSSSSSSANGNGKDNGNGNNEAAQRQASELSSAALTLPPQPPTPPSATTNDAYLSKLATIDIWREMQQRSAGADGKTFPVELQNKFLSKGTAFTMDERERYNILGLVPPTQESLEEAQTSHLSAWVSGTFLIQQQAARAITHVRSYQSMLNKYIYMENLHALNVKLFYKVLMDNMVELLPVLYTPTVGEACQKFGDFSSLHFQGLYLSVNERGSFRHVLENWVEEPEIIVVTDGGRILGLGDLGAGGMGIPIGKLHLYVGGGGFHPSKTLPVMIDVGCDKESVITSPNYLGLRIQRIKGAEHEAIMDEFMEAVHDKWPKCIIQFEDFQSDYALRYLEKYRGKYVHFNDDVQGTAAIVTAGFINGMKAQGTALTDAKVIMYGAGSSAVGVATYLMRAMCMAGLEENEARSRIYMVDTKGLITTTRGDALNQWKTQFARTDGVPDISDLQEIIAYVKPNALFGLTGAGPSFSKGAIEELCAGCARPLLFPLSNPTSQAEITIDQAAAWSKGKCIFAAGSPFENADYNGKTIYASQCNNMFIFPGVGMGTKLSQANGITDNMLLAAANAVADYVSAEDIEAGKLYPDLSNLRDIGMKVTQAVWEQAMKDGKAAVDLPPANAAFVIESNFYLPSYHQMKQPRGYHPLFANAQKDTFVSIPPDLINPYTYRSTHYTYSERSQKGILGLVAPARETLAEQAARCIANIRQYSNPINKYVYLEQLRARNATLFYKVLLSNIVELCPVIYTPTVGEACQRFGQIFRNSAGMYLSYDEQGKLREVLDNWPYTPDIIVVTDGGRILGLGDLGAGGIGIPIGKLHLYCAGGGFHPERTLPIQLDVGCDNEAIVTDPTYLGNRMPRLRDAQHEAFVDEFMEAVKDKWPECIIQFEDFQSSYALKYLEKYRHDYLHFNDDVQGTAAIVTAGFINGMKAQGTALIDAKIIMFGAGSSAVGVATYLCNAMVLAGLTPEEARNRIYMIDSKGLITSSRGDALDKWKQKFMRTDKTPNMKRLVDVIEYVKPNALFGLTGSGPSFDKDAIEGMCKGTSKPLIFPLSNPTSKAEITIQQAVEYSNGDLLFAAGSPFPNVEYQKNGRHQTIFACQCNNMFIFPGVGMGAHLAGATTITDGMLLAAAFTVADYVTAEDIKRGRLYPELSFLRPIGKAIAKAVWEKAFEEGVATNPPPVNIRKVIHDAFYEPKYTANSYYTDERNLKYKL